MRTITERLPSGVVICIFFLALVTLSFGQGENGAIEIKKTLTTEARAEPPPAEPVEYVPLKKKERVKRYWKSIASPATIGRHVATAGFSTWTNSPKEWGGQLDGFGKRLGSNLAKGAIRNTTTFALDEAFGLDSRFIRSRDRRFKAKVTNALVSPLIARNRKGDKVFGFPRLAGAYTANIIAAETWYPKRYSWKDGVRSGTISIGTGALLNLVREFVGRK